MFGKRVMKGGKEETFCEDLLVWCKIKIECFRWGCWVLGSYAQVFVDL